MAGCTNCGNKSGCDHRKGDMMASVDDALAALYPDRRWHAMPAVDAASADADAAALADELADVLGAATFATAAQGGGAAYVHVLAMGRPPCALQIRDHDLPWPDEWAIDSGPLSERYLRVALSTRAPFAVVQELAVEISLAADGAVLREEAMAGVYSAPLLARFQRIVATLPAYDRRHLDLGDLLAPPPGFDGGAWTARYTGHPGAVNYLFFAEPASLTRTLWVPRSGG